MRRTLFLIPHEIGPLTVFGFGWIFGLLVIALIIRLAIAARARSVLGDEAPSIPAVLASEFVFWGMATFAIFAMPKAELLNAYGEPLGVAVRGYGVFLLLGVSSAIGLAAFRATRTKSLTQEHIYSLAPWIIASGLIGARLFYVIQYRDDFVGASAGETLRNVLAFTQGGLVVYGSIIGGTIGFAIFCYRNRLSALELGDVVIPAVFLGICLGRIGCLMNGCCYGGRCEEGWTAVRFPPINEVYQEQLRSGELLGLEVNQPDGVILSVQPDSVGESRGVQPGEIYEGGRLDPRPLETADPDVPRGDVELGWVASVSGRPITFEPDQLPDRALPVRAAQLISSVTALVLCLSLCVLSRFVSRAGILMLIGFAAYAVIRFILEMIRVDEAGQFNTSLSISQWVSVVVLSASIVGLFWIGRQPVKPNE
ncbi:MAG: prolipoprotein diacylglyceryl transferase family protein [Planctomycetota bacterium]